jgi:hypothetical protein
MKSSAEWLLLAACAGLTLGVAARIAMRVVALQAEVVPAFSWGGTVEIVVFGALVGAPIALLFWACRARLHLPPWSSVAVGLLVFGALVVWPPPSARSALRGTPDAPSLTALAFAGVFVVYGVALEVLWRVKRRK